MQGAQRGQRRLLVARQHIAGMGGFGKALVRQAQQLDIACVGQAAIGIAPRRCGHLRLQARGALELRQQARHRALLQRLGHRKAGAAGVLQKAGDIGAEPGLIGIAGRPQAEAALRLLHAGQAAEGQVQALGAHLARQRCDAEGRRAGFVDEDQRVGAAGGLLQAAIGVHQQALHRVTHVDGRLVRQGQRHRRRAGPQAFGQRRVELDAAVDIHAQPAHLAQQWRRRLHLQRSLAHELELAGLQRQRDRRQAKGVAGLGAEAQHAALLVGQCHRGRAAADLQRRASLKLHAHLLRRTRQVGDIERDGRGVARCDEARHRQLGHDGCGHRQLDGVAGVAVGAAGHGHQAQRAVEVGQGQRDGRFAVAVQRHRAAEQVHQPDLARQALRVAFAGVAAKALFGDIAVHALDQLAVQVLHVGVVAVLAKKVVDGVGRGIARDVEDAQVHRRQRDDGVAAAHRLAHRVGELDLDRHALLGRALGRGAQGQLELAGIARQRQVHQAKRARRRHAVALAARAEGHHADVQVVPVPAGVHRDLDQRARRLHAHALAPQHPVALDGDQRLAVVRRRDGEAGHITALEGRAFEFQRHAVGAVAQVVGVLRAPASVEAVAGGLPGVGVEHLDAVAAIAHLQCDLAARRQRDAARLSQLLLLGVAAGPAAAVFVAPVPLAVFADEAQLQLLGRAELARSVAARDFEFGQRAFAHHAQVEQRADAHQQRRRPPLPLDGAHHRPAA